MQVKRLFAALHGERRAILSVTPGALTSKANCPQEGLRLRVKGIVILAVIPPRMPILSVGGRFCPNVRVDVVHDGAGAEKVSDNGR